MSVIAQTGAQRSFDWQPQPEAQALVTSLLDEFLGRSSFGRTLADRMAGETGTRFGDWVDHIEIGADHSALTSLASVGFVSRGDTPLGECFVHPGAMFPKIVRRSEPGSTIRVAIKVDRIEDCLAAHEVDAAQANVQGEPLAPVRWATLASNEDHDGELRIIERHGTQGFDIEDVTELFAALVRQHTERFATRPRGGIPVDIAFEDAIARIEAASEDIGQGYTCDLFFLAEREYWMSRNTAGRVQYERQCRLGLGWANHDHHTFRSSRERFNDAIAVFEALGLECRERFYAGEEAGWGAQVLESAATNIVVFCDVDLAPGEIQGDIAHEPLPELGSLGTVGLWTALHGESMIEAGMHHLEAQFDWHKLVDQLEHGHDIKTMAPFTTFPFLRQAFTEGERWPVDHARVDRLLERGQITEDKAAEFRERGALGSHLENLERNDGFKGFNQTGVSDIIKRTDPRAH